MAERTDDGRRHMPKMKCPYGNHRFADVPDVALRNDSELKRLSEASDIDYILECPSVIKRWCCLSKCYEHVRQSSQGP